MATKAQRRAYKKAARIRKGIRDGKEVSAAQLEWLKRYEAAKDGGTPVEEGNAESDPGDEGDGIDDDGPDLSDDPDPGNDGMDPGSVEPGPGDGAAPAGAPAPGAPPKVDAPPSSPPPPPGPRPRPTPPPRTSAHADASRAAGGTEKWQAKYKKDSRAAGREATCEKIADAWVGVLGLMCNQMREVGVSPMIEPADLRPAMILTLDDLLPSNIELKPEHVAVGGTTVLLAQRFMARKAIAEKQGAEKAKTDATEAARQRAERVANMQAEQQRERDERAKNPPTATQDEVVAVEVAAPPVPTGEYAPPKYSRAELEKMAQEVSDSGAVI